MILKQVLFYSLTKCKFQSVEWFTEIILVKGSATDASWTKSNLLGGGAIWLQVASLRGKQAMWMNNICCYMTWQQAILLGRR